MTTFKVRAGSVIGQAHHQSWRNCQDKYRLATYHYEGRAYLSGLVCDGCSEADHSEVGAALLAEYGVMELGRLLQAGHGVKELPVQLYGRCLTFISILCDQLVGTGAESLARKEQIANYWLTTVVGFVIGEVESVIFVAGDGFTLVNDTLQDHQAGPAPRYMAYDLLDEPGQHRTAGFEVLELATASIERLAVWTDGFQPDLLPELARLGRGSRALQRQLNIWANQKKLSDDTTGILVEREVVGHEDQA